MTSRQPLIVVVDDDADMNRAMESMLSAAGFATSMHGCAESLLEAGVPPDAACLLLDVHLPGISGFELHDRLMSTRCPPVVFMTAHDAPVARVQSQRAGAIAYFVKPFDGRELITTLRRVSQRD